MCSNTGSVQYSNMVPKQINCNFLICLKAASNTMKLEIKIVNKDGTKNNLFYLRALICLQTFIVAHFFKTFSNEHFMKCFKSAGLTHS